MPKSKSKPNPMTRKDASRIIGRVVSNTNGKIPAGSRLSAIDANLQIKEAAGKRPK